MTSFKSLRQALLMGVATFGATAAVSATEQAAYAQEVTRTYNIQAQDLNSALREFALQTGRDVLYPPEIVAGKRSNGAQGQLTERQALDALLAGTGLRFEQTASNGYAVQDPNSPTRLGDADEAAPSEEIVVTGTRIRGVTPDSSPFLSFDRDDIEQSGAASVEQFMRQVPQNFSNVESGNQFGVAATPDVSNNQTRGASVNLRGLGSSATLILLNGHRLAPAGRTGAQVDVSLIPLSAIERIEILPDGASAIYGADAVSGVVNYVLRQDYDGAETSLRYGYPTRGGGEEFGASQTLGASWRTGSVLAAFEYFEQDPIRVSDRDFITPIFGFDKDGTIGTPSQRQSLMLVGRQQLAAGTELTGDILLAERVVQFNQDTTSGVGVQESDNQSINAALGLTQDMFGDWQTAVTVSYSDLDAVETLVSIGGVPFGTETHLTSRSLGADIIADGSILTLPAGAIRASVGGSWRQEDFSNTAAGAVGEDDRSVHSVFGEIFVPIFGRDSATPLIRRLELTAALRYDEYSDFGDTTNSRLGLLWSPVEDLRLRTTYSTSFRAPSLGELNPNGVSGLAFNIPSPLGGTVPAVLRSGSNSSLSPETATSYTAGFDYAPAYMDGLNVSLTYFHIDYEDRISAPPATSPALVLFQQAVLGPYLDFSPDVAEVTAIFATPGFLNFSGATPAQIQVIYDGRLQNIGQTVSEGIDLSIDYTRATGVGDVTFGLNAQHLITNSARAAPGVPEVSRLDDIFQPADLRLRGSLSWSTETLGAGLVINYVDDYRNTLTTPDSRISSWTTYDLSVRFEPDGGALRGTRFGLAITNVLDEEPPATGITFGFDPTNASFRGRVVSLSLIKAW